MPRFLPLGIWVIGALLLLPTASAAGDIRIDSQTSYGDLDFDLIDGGVIQFDTDLREDLVMQTALGDLPLNRLIILGTTGPLTELVRHRGGPFEFDDYTYGPGGAAFLSFEFDLPDGTTHTMTLRGAFPELQIEAYDTGGEFAPFSIETSIDKDSAKLFGWRAHGVRFNFDWYLMDFNRDDFDEPARFGRSYGDLSITGTDVPEPALMALLPLGVGLAFRRRRRRCSSDT